MERTVTIPLWEYDNLRETVKRLTDEGTAAETRNAELESQLSQIRDIVAPADDESDDGNDDGESEYKSTPYGGTSVIMGGYEPKSGSPSDWLRWHIDSFGSH